jgi:hypothetical protein
MFALVSNGCPIGKRTLGMTEWIRRLMVALPMLSASLPAWAQTTTPSTNFFKFLCQIDLKQNGLDNPQSGPILYTFDSEKHCTGSPSAINIFITCRAQVPGWPAGTSVVKQGPDCAIAGAPCGLVGLRSDTTNNKLTVDGTGLATLTCQFKNS